MTGTPEADLRGSLVVLGSGYRSRPPAETLEVARVLMAGLGISRVTDITRMDRLGLPVFTSVRPRGKVLRVHAGKGVRSLEARVGALMEAVEFAVAEPQKSAWVMRTLTAAAVVAQFDNDLGLGDFVPMRGVKVMSQQPVPTVACDDLRRHETVQIPAELVFVPYEPENGPTLFGATSNGLASGNTLEEATLHALFEIIERDAISMNKARDESQWVDCEDLPEPFGGLATAWRDLGIDLAVRHVPNPFELPCFEAFLYEQGSTSVNLAEGSGAHFDRGIALARAVCEAAQSRLTQIHGGREDVTGFFAKYTEWSPAKRADLEETALRQMFDKSRSAGFGDLPHAPYAHALLSTVLDDLLERMSRAGFGSVFRHRFSVELNGLHVVKLVVPKCEDIEHNARRIGPRLLARLIGNG